MSLTDAIITEDVEFIFEDLEGTGATETVTWQTAGQSETTGTFGVLRAKQKTSQDLQSTGFETKYRFSVFAKRTAIGALVEGDVIVMANGDRLRVFRIEEQPARVVVMIDLGDEFEDGSGLE